VEFLEGVADMAAEVVSPVIKEIDLLMDVVSKSFNTIAFQPVSMKPSEPMPIPSWTRALARGEEEAFRRLYDVYFLRLYRYLLVAAYGNEVMAQDAVQETMIRVARKVQPMRSEEDFWRWLTTVARNVLRDQARRQNRYRGMLDRLTDWFGFQGGDASVSTHLNDLDQDYHSVLQKSIESLPEGDRFLMTQKYPENQSVKQIATCMDTTPKAVESKLTRLRKSLKKELLNQLKDRHED